MWTTTIIGIIIMLIVLAMIHSGAGPEDILWDGDEGDDIPFDPEDSTKRVEDRLNGKS